MKKLIRLWSFTPKIKVKSPHGDITPRGINRTVICREYLERFPVWEGSLHPERFPNQIIV